MTVATEASVAELVWTGSETLFTPGLSAQSTANVRVAYCPDGVGEQVSLIAGVHLTLTKAGGAGETGAITGIPVAMPAAPGTVIFTRDTPALQPTIFEQLAAYSARVHEKLHDAAALRDAELKQRADELDEAVALLNVLVLGESDGALETLRAALGLDNLFYAMDFPGVVGNGIADDTAALQAAIDYVASRGGGILRVDGGRHLIDSADLLIRSAVFLQGPWLQSGEREPANLATLKGMLLLNAAYTIRYDGPSCGMEGIIIARKGLTLPTNMRTALDMLASYAGTAITIGNGTSSRAPDAHARYLLILGFAQAIISDGNSRPHLDYIFGDCTNGISLTNCFDLPRLNHCHFWPAMTAPHSFALSIFNIIGVANNGAGKIRITTLQVHLLVTGDPVNVTGVAGCTEANGRWTVTVIDATHLDLQGSAFVNAYVSGGEVYVHTLRRGGTAYRMTTVDWGQAIDCFEYGYEIGFDIHSSNHGALINCGADHFVPAHDPSTIGYKMNTGTGVYLLSGCKGASYGTAILIDNGVSALAAYGAIRIQGCDFWGAINGGGPTPSHFIHGVTGRALINGCTLHGQPTTAQITLDSTFGKTTIAHNEFAGAATVFNIHATALKLVTIGPNQYTDGVDGVAGNREVIESRLPDITRDVYIADSRGTPVHYRKARGGPTAPTAVQLADNAFRIYGDVYNGSAFTPAAGWRVVVGLNAGAAGTISAASSPGTHIWSVTADGAITETDVMALDAVQLALTVPVAAKAVRGVAVAFASLPSPAVEGMMVAVNDSNTAVWGATIAAGGANHVLAYYNGTNWTVAGK